MIADTLLRRALPRLAGLGTLLLAAAAPVFAQDTALPPVGCLIYPQEVVRLTPAAPGIVKRVAVERGDSVSAGDVLVEFDSAAEEIALDLATAAANDRSQLAGLETRLAFLEDQATRLEALAASGSSTSTAAHEARMEAEVAARDLDRERASLERAELERRAAEVRLERTRILAPIDGVVVERGLAPGEYRDTQTAVMTLARLDRLRVEAFAPIGHFGALAPGQEVTVHPEAPIGGSWPATITIVDRVLDAATATFGFRAEMENPGFALPAGLRCEVEFGAAPAP